PPFELEVILTIPELAANQAVVYVPDGGRARVEPTPEAIVLEVWTVALSGGWNTGVTPPPIYKHGMALFRSIYTLLRTLPAWSLYKRIRRRTGGIARTGALSISLRLRPHPHSLATLAFDQMPAPALPPIPTKTQAFPPVQLPPGTLEFSVTYLATPHFEIDELESVLSSRFISADLNAGEGFVPTLNKSSSRQSQSHSPHRPQRENETIAERFILPSKNVLPGSSASPRDPLARLRKESVASVHYTAPSPTGSPRQRKQSLNSNSSPTSSIISQGPFLSNSTTIQTTTAITSPLPIRRPNLNPFKSNTISSPSNSSPSISLRTGGPSSLSNPTNLTLNTNIPPTNSPLTTTNPQPPTPLPQQPSSVSSNHSVHTHLRHASLSGGTSTRPPISPIIPTGGAYPFIERERERRMSTLSNMSVGERERVISNLGGGGEASGGTSPVPVPPPTRKRYSSSFGHRYVGSGGSNPGGVGTGAGEGGVGTVATTGGGSGPGSVGTGGGGARPGTPDVGTNKPTYLSTNPDEDDISIFVQEIDARKPLIGRAREYNSSNQPPSVSPLPLPSSSSPRTAAPTDTSPGSGSNNVVQPGPREPLGMLPGIGLGLAGISNWAAYGPEAEEEEEGEGKSRFAGRYARDRVERVPLSPTNTGTGAGTGGSPAVSPTLLQARYHHQQQTQRRESGAGGGRSSVSPPMGALRMTPISAGGRRSGGSGSPVVTSPTSRNQPPVTQQQSMAQQQQQATYQLSTSPTSPARGPMLTSQEEVGERLRRMNEVFFKSLEGIRGGGGERERRRREREREILREERELEGIGSWRGRGRGGIFMDMIRGLGWGLGFLLVVVWLRLVRSRVLRRRLKRLRLWRRH
ncbi:hypothetical protein P691DRAFT_167778, partial [Macrolepiota fuliginosa MF-IS2]